MKILGVVIPNTTYKVFTALLTQSGPSSVVNLGSEDVRKGVTYLFDGGSGYDFSNVGGPIYPENYPFLATETAQPNDVGTSEWIYDAGAPTAVVLENTIGNIWFTYGFAVNSDNLFNNVFLNTFNFYNNGNDTVSILTANIDDKSSSIIWYDIFDLQGNSTFFTNLPFEIRVYN